MSGNSTNKSEKPTPKKLADARKRGQVPRSKELVSALIMAAFLTVFYISAPFFYGELDEMFTYIIDRSHEPFNDVLTTTFKMVFSNSLAIVVPLLIVIVAVTVIGTFAQGGWVFSFHPIKPNLENLSPAKTLKQIFSIKNLVELFKSLIKASVLALIIYFIIVDNFNSLMNIPYCGPKCSLEVWGYMAFLMFMYCAIFYMIVAIFDAVFQYNQHMKSLHMSPEEVKQEFKEMEGNMELKGMRTSLYREIISESLTSDVQNSSVVVTNPTHLAIGLYYEKGKTGLPIITLKESGDAAHIARTLAEKLQVPVVQNIPLARQLMSKGTKHDRIPNELIEDVAKVLRWVMKISKKQKKGGRSQT